MLVSAEALHADIALTPSPGTTSPRSMNRGESLSQDGVAWPEIDGLNDADLDDEIEAFERSLRADWEVGLSSRTSCMLSRTTQRLH